MDVLCAQHYKRERALTVDLLGATLEASIIDLPVFSTLKVQASCRELSIVKV